MFGPLPALGLYGRHVEGLTLRNIEVRSEQPDARPAIVLDDVSDLDLDGFRPARPRGESPVLWLNNVAGALVRGARAPEGNALFLRVTGPRSRRIVVSGSDLAGARQAVQVSSEASPSEVVVR